ncbi:Protein SABRE [Saxophila tyrrhenica]|uniref:Protein SABRE n=1 Tax=Saxophila tyrrhenica TaxID=1690608 RepID=A0AAV9P4L6_9PEZI|nr:Protein SABRE [Saxophila tyrrhenica]
MLPHPSFLLGLLVILYLCTFVAFAILRIVTGVSIQRVGFSGFRRIGFSLRNGVRVHVRGVGVSLHRPTFALPTWCSLVVTEAVVTVDLNAVGDGHGKANGAAGKENGSLEREKRERKAAQDERQDEDGHGKLWRRLTEIKEKIKRLHSKIGWIRLVDLLVTDTTVNIVGVGSIQLERLSLSVDTRSKTVDRSRLFQHHKTKPDTQSPAEWKSMIRSILFTPEGRDSTEVLDYATINIHGMLHNELQGLRDASVAVKLGRLNVPYDDIEHAKKCADMLRGKYAQPNPEPATVTISNALEELERVETQHQDQIVRTVSDSRAFVASILRGIQEVQFAVSFFGLSRKMNVRSDTGKDVYFNLAMKEIGLDVLRLDPKSPAHRMYFASKDVAHQGLLTAIAISAGIDDGHEHPERMVYIPMVTATVRTTLPSRTIHYSQENNASERNTNILYANFVCTSPSVDLDPKHLPLVREVLKRHSSSDAPKQKIPSNRHHLISQLLPKAYIKLSIQEPVIRVSLPPMHRENAAEDDYDLLISSVSSIGIELESSHAAEGPLHYSLRTHYRHSRHHLYYQTFAGDRHDLLHSDTVELQVDVNALPDAAVVASGRLQTFTIYMVRPEISEGVRQIVKQLRRNVLARHDGEDKRQMSFLRQTPQWLQQCRIEGSDFGLELAGVDEQVSKDRRGFALQLESWTTEYKAQRDERPDMFTRRHSISRAMSLEKKQTMEQREAESPRRRPKSIADGRRLTVHLQNLEGFIMDSVDNSPSESCLSVPRFEVAFTTSTDNNGPVFHINSHAKSMLMQYSLYNHFAMGVAVMVIRKTFLDLDKEEVKREARPQRSRQRSLQVPGDLNDEDEVARHEVTIIDFKANLIQVKARMPADPPMMIQLFNPETGRHRYGTPFLRCKVARLYVRAPRTQRAWSRILSIRMLRVDMRELRRKVGKHHVAEKSIDIVAEVIRIGVPHSLVVHTIFDNITNVIKTTKQLQHHFVTGTNEYILAKEPEGPKHVPRITLRNQLLIFDIEDSSFEFKLNSIYRAGLMEQKQRLAREDAFKMKEKRLARSSNRRGSQLRARSAQPDGRARSKTRGEETNGGRRSQSNEPRSRWSPKNSQRQSRRRGRAMRYETDGKCGISDTSQLSIAAARDKLDRLNAQSWKTRIDRMACFQSQAIRDIRSYLLAADDLPEEAEQHEPILALSRRPGLMVAALNDLTITIDKPSFPIDEYPKFMHDIGKGMPHDMKYGLLVPMSLHITMSEARFQLRDYPLPLLHVPALASGQSPRLPSLSMRTDFVIAEEFRDIESQRHVNVEVVPKEKMSTESAFTIDVRRTISPVKTYSNMKFEINTSRPTKITWGTSYQPAIQDTMQVVEAFTKPAVDVSDRVGFWDKIRLGFHSRVNVAWKGDGDVHLVLKGSRDPYVVTGTGAGLVMVWRNDVQWNIAQSNDPRQFMTVDSSDYILAVPDFGGYARSSQEFNEGDAGSSSSTSSNPRDAVFKKVVMKLSGKVRWLGGMVFERDVGDGSRSFDFIPHYNVVLKDPQYAKAPPGKEYDAYSGFRSHHIHMSVAVAAPHDRQWSVTNVQPSNNYNAIHLTPRFFSHFYSWWSMFSGIMSLPIRQGPLWGGMTKKSKKLGRHLATFKYNVLLSPLFVSHVYKHKDAEDYQENVVSATGLKMRLDSFMLDLHQRREYFDIKGHEGAQSKTSSGIRINQAQLDFIHADLRALSASIAGTSTEDIEKANDDALASLYGQLPVVDMSKFTIPDNDFSWIDMDDFVELDWILPAESDPETKILPLGYAPRFTYFRQTDHHGFIAGDSTRRSTFGEEPTHYCVMSAKNDPRRVQVELIEKRLHKLNEQRTHNERAAGDAELKFVQSVTTDSKEREKLRENLDALRTHADLLERKYHFLEAMLETLSQRLESDDPSAVPDLETSEAFFEAHENAQPAMDDSEDIEAAPLADYTSDFNNRFIVHNAQIKWNNSLRNIILRYIHQVSQRRGFVYYMSRRAVKFILDVIDERKKTEDVATPTRKKSVATEQGPMSPDSIDDESTIQDRIDQLLKDGRSFVNAEDQADTNDVENVPDAAGAGPTDDIAVEYTPLNTYHFRLIAPQIQLQSEKNSKAAVLVTAKGMQLKVVQIMDKDRVSDDVSGLVQRRFRAAADSLQMFVTTTKTFTTEHLHMYSANRYGAKAGTYWPPWVPMEMMFEFETNPYGFSRVVHRTSTSLRYDKYNTLRLKYNDDISGGESTKTTSRADEAESRMDHVWLEFPHIRAICDSAQYFALYIIVMDLLLYSEPLEKTRTERLEKIMLASDFSDLSGAPEMVQMLQERIRQLEEIKMHFQVNEKYLDRQGWKDRIAMDQDLAGCEDELFFMMKAITTAQQRVEDRREHENVAGSVHLNMSAKEIAWHMIRGKDESLMEVQLSNASFDRTDNNDGSNYNSMEIGRINGYNLLPDALYPEIIGPFIDESRGFHEHKHGKMLRVHWLMLEAIAGIPVVDYFEVDLVPLKVQIEREVAKKLFEYIFPGVGGNAFEGGGFSPFMVKNMLPTQEEEDESEAKGTDAPTPMVEDLEPTNKPSHGSGLASLEERLKPTVHLQTRKKPPESRGLGISAAREHVHGFGLFQHSDRSRSALPGRAPASQQALASTNNLSPMSRTTSERSLATMRSSANGSEPEKRRFLHRTHSEERKKETERSDDLTQMMNRASNYMTLSFVKIPSMVLCLSYKGQGKRNLEDVHDLVFRMPTLEYRNKTWSNLDLALQLKKDVIRALISHAGAIVSNKFSHHKPTRLQQTKLREIANMSTFMSPRASSTALQEGGPSEDSSLNERSARSPERMGRPSTASARPSTLSRSISVTSSTPSGSSHAGDKVEEANGAVTPGAAGSLSGQPMNGQGTPKRRMSLPRSSPGAGEGDQYSRLRTASMSRRLSGFGDRLRQRPSNSNSNEGEETDESRRKNKLVLSGQKLLRTFRDQ